MMGDLKRMLDPGAIALIGATEKEGTLGRALVENLRQSDTKEIFFVNPHRKNIFGVPCYPSVRALPVPLDLALIAVRAALVPEALEECGQAATEGVVIISAGFAEAGDEGRDLEDQLVDIRSRYGMRIIGPASFGIIRPGIGLHASFLRAQPEKGNIAFIAQNGQLGSAMLEWASEARVGFSMFASLGSMIDVDFGDLIDFLGNDFATRSVLLNMQRVVDARKFMSAARGFARTKPILVMKPGRFAESWEAGTCEGDVPPVDDAVYDAAFKRVGVVRIAEAKDLFDAAQVLDSEHLPAGPRLAIIGNADMITRMAADVLIGEGGCLAKLSPESPGQPDLALIRKWSGKNPLDLGGQAGVDSYAMAMHRCLNDPMVDGLLVIYTTLGTTVPPDLARVIASIANKARKPVIVAWMGGREMIEGRAALREQKVPAYATPEEAVKAYLQMFRHKQNLDLLYETPAELLINHTSLGYDFREMLQKAIEGGESELTTQQSMRLLADYGIPIGPVMERADRSTVDCELYLEMTRDRDFGSVIRFGLGGMARDIFKDCAIGLPPLNQTLARRLIEESKARTVLSGYGGLKPLDISKLELMLVSFSDLIVDLPEIVSIFVAPLVVWEGHIRALGARMFLASSSGSRSEAHPHLVITPYPTRYISAWRLRDGTKVLLRPIRPEDEPLQNELFSTLSEETVRERFFSVIKDMSHEMLVRFCNIDYDREIAIVAEVRDGDKRRIAGISRLIIEPGSKAQFAVLVHDGYQGKGLGWKLMDVLIAIARRKGLTEVYGLTLRENHRMQKLAKSFGFTAVLMPGGIVRVTLKLA